MAVKDERGKMRFLYRYNSGLSLTAHRLVEICGKKVKLLEIDERDNNETVIGESCE